ncbi:esterase/lipase family protein [Amycolatopsis jiangsuensis]|uniref:Lipase n=1 Tax=Amycolatopsis jiangsuensis TaxID=1181879 RepID=A0A840J297_9PSEU|nr:lipase [Amycolatopsis jiangsuensis]MBB4687552.1 hypothetical protein [Amycolatopsis jiangsuensis]
MKSTIAKTAGVLLACLGLTLALSAPAGAETGGFAPVDRPGPALQVPEAELAAAVHCTANATNADQEVLLFVPGTTLTPDEYSWNWFKALDKLGKPYCSVTEPDNAMGDAQISAEYVVYAIRHVHEISGRKIAVLGHSQGGTEPRFALRFWPDVRPMVADYVTFAGTNHGSPLINALCPPVAGCSPSLWQQTVNSQYIQAMNSGQETFPGISYTNIYSIVDEFVQPNLDDNGTTSLHGGGGSITNVSIQSVCPTDLASEHIAVGTYDPVAYALAMDAVTHDGPASPARVPASTCGHLLMPGVDPVTFATDLADTTAVIAKQLALHPRVAAEPPLQPYVHAG